MATDATFLLKMQCTLCEHGAKVNQSTVSSVEIRVNKRVKNSNVGQCVFFKKPQVYLKPGASVLTSSRKYRKSSLVAV